MELDPKNRTDLLLKTAALMHLGRLDKALEMSNKQLQLEDDDARVAALAAAVRYRTKNYADDAAISRKAIALMAKPELADPVAGSVALILIGAGGQLGNGSGRRRRGANSRPACHRV